MFRQKLNRRATLVAGAAAPLAALALVAAPAHALAPTTVDQHIVRHLIPGQCNGQLVVADFDFYRTLTTFYDADGVATRQVVHAHIVGTTTNTVTGVSLPTFGERNIFFSGTGDFQFTNGTNTHVVVPGSGTVQIGAGYLGFDNEGNFVDHGRLDAPLTEALCAALAG